MSHFAIQSLQGLMGRLITLSLLHAVWIGLLVASLAAMALRMVPLRQSRLRHTILLAALTLVAIGPPVATSLQRSRVGSPESRFVPSPTGTIRVIPGRSISEPNPTPRAARSRSHSASTLATLHEATDGLVSRLRIGFETLQPFILAVWLLVVAPLMLFLVLGVQASRRLQRGARGASEWLQERCDRLSRGLGLRHAPPVLIHSHLADPCLCGLVRPAILLPASWLEDAENNRLDAILAHELAHARRLDLPVNLAQRLVEIALFFHPAVLWLSRSLRRQREICADALAVSLTGHPVALAEALESFARTRSSRRHSTLLSESLGGDGLFLLPRIQEILGMTPSRPPVRFWPLAALPSAVLVALFSVSVSLAQNPPESASNEESRDRPEALQVSEHPSGNEAPTRAVSFEFVEKSERNSRCEARTDGTPYSTRQISYEVRFLTTGASSWRERVKDRLRPVKIEGETEESAWLLDQERLFDFMQIMQESIESNLVMAPKLTAFEGAHATLLNTVDQSYVADVKPIQGPGSLAFRPEIKPLTLGTTIELSGTLEPDRTNLTLNLREKALVTFHLLTRTQESPAGRISAQYQVPTTTERHCHLSCPIPDGSSLMISLGFEEQSRPLTGVAGAAVTLLEATGVPPLETRGETYERLILITPRRIILDDQKTD